MLIYVSSNIFCCAFRFHSAAPPRRPPSSSCATDRPSVSIFLHPPHPTALVVATAAAFAPGGTQQRRPTSPRGSLADEVDYLGNNVAVKNLLIDVETSGLLTKVAKSGLLSKAQEAGLTLGKLEPLLALAAENKDVLILVEAATPEVLPILPKLVQLAPGALPLLASAVSVPPSALGLAGVACLGAAVGAVVLIPDDSVLQVAEQTLAVGVLGAAGVASLAGSAILGQLFK